MTYLLDPVREPIDQLERLILDRYSRIDSVHAIRLRYLPIPDGASNQRLRVWLQLEAFVPKDLEQCDRVNAQVAEFIRFVDIDIEVMRILGCPPASEIGAACIFRRTARPEIGERVAGEGRAV